MCAILQVEYRIMSEIKKKNSFNTFLFPSKPGYDSLPDLNTIAQSLVPFVVKQSAFSDTGSRAGKYLKCHES